MKRNPRGTFYVTVYETEERYGGPEEGGWWYEAGSPTRHIRVKGLNAAEKLAASLTDGSRRALTNPSFDHEIAGPNDCDGSERFETKTRALVARRPGSFYPHSRPSYE